MACACHVGRWQEYDALADAAYARFGRIDVLINNAGKFPLYDRPVDTHNRNPEPISAWCSVIVPG